MKLRSLPAAVHGAFGGALFLMVAHFLSGALAVQNELVPPTSGIFTGVQFSQKIGDAFRSIAGCNKGSTAPANVGGSAVDGLCWIDDSASPWVMKRFVNGGWAIEGAFDPADSSYAGIVGGGLGTIASATTTDLGSVPQANVTISGTTTITGFGSSAPSGVVKFIRFSGALKLTNSAALTIPGGYDLTTAANDRAIVTHLGSGNWEITSFTRDNGIPIDVSAVGDIIYNFSETVPALRVAGYGQAISRATYPAYFAKATRTQNGTRVSGNATISALTSVAGLGVGMRVEGTGIAANCTIASIVGTSITLNSSSCVTSSGTSPVIVFLYGYGAGGDTTTVGVKDCRGRTPAGRDNNLPGSLANLLTASYFGVDSSVFGATGGSESKTLSIANLDAFTPSGSFSSSISGGNVSIPQQGNWSGSPTAVTSAFSEGSNNKSGTQLNVSVTGTVSGSLTMNALGSGTPHRTVQPTFIAECTVRVTP